MRLIERWRDCKILWWSPGPGCRWIIPLDCDPGPRVAVEADLPRWQTLDWMWAGAETITTPRGPRSGQGSSPVSSATSSHSSSSDESIRQVNDRRTTYLIWCALDYILWSIAICCEIDEYWLKCVGTNWIVFAANENSYFARVLLRYQSWNIFCTPEPENLEC